MYKIPKRSPGYLRDSEIHPEGVKVVLGDLGNRTLNPKSSDHQAPQGVECSF